MTIVNQYPVVESGPAWSFAWNLLRGQRTYCRLSLIR